MENSQSSFTLFRKPLAPMRRTLRIGWRIGWAKHGTFEAGRSQNLVFYKVFLLSHGFVGGTGPALTGLWRREHFAPEWAFRLGKTSSFEKVLRTPSSAELKSLFSEC